MGAYVLRRLWQMIPTLAGVMLLIFFLFNAVGGDPAFVLAGKITNKEQIENIRKQLGVDRPYVVQLGYFAFEVATGFTCTFRSSTHSGGAAPAAARGVRGRRGSVERAFPPAPPSI